MFIIGAQGVHTVSFKIVNAVIIKQCGGIVEEVGREITNYLLGYDFSDHVVISVI